MTWRTIGLLGAALNVIGALLLVVVISPKLFASIAAGYTGRMRDAVVATAIGAIAVLGNTIIVIVV